MQRNILPYAPEFKSPLLALFRSQFRGEFEPSEQIMLQKISKDPDHDEQLTLVAVENGKLRGFVMGVIRDVRGESIGYIKLLLVDARVSQQGTADALVREIEQRMIAQGVSKLRFFDAPLNYLFPGIPALDTALLCLAEKHGYKRFNDTVNMVVELKENSRIKIEHEKEIQLLKDQEITIARVEESDYEHLLAFIRSDFDLWEYEVRQSLNVQPVAVHIAKDSAGKIIAFSAFEGNNQGTGWFGPMGTTPECRGKGIGGILLKRCLVDLKEIGFKQAIIPWVGPIGFYAKEVGAKISSIYWRYEKVVTSA